MRKIPSYLNYIAVDYDGTQAVSIEPIDAMLSWMGGYRAGVYDSVRVGNLLAGAGATTSRQQSRSNLKFAALVKKSASYLKIHREPTSIIPGRVFHT